MKKGEFLDLIKEKSAQNFLYFMIQQLKNPIQTIDGEKVISNCIVEIGNPVFYHKNIKQQTRKTIK